MSLQIDLDTSNYDVKMRFFRSRLPLFPPKAVKEATDIIEKNMVQVVPVRQEILETVSKNQILE